MRIRIFVGDVAGHRGDLPFGGDCDIDMLVSQEMPEIVGGPGLCGGPVGGALFHDKGRIAGDISHELQRAGLLVQLLNDRAVQLVVGCNELCDGVHGKGHSEDKAGKQGSESLGRGRQPRARGVVGLGQARPVGGGEGPLRCAAARSETAEAKTGMLRSWEYDEVG